MLRSILLEIARRYLIEALSVLCQNILRLTQQIGSFFLFEMHCALSSCDFFSTASSCSLLLSLLWYWLFPVYFQVSPIYDFFHIQDFCLFCPDQVTERTCELCVFPSPPKKNVKKANALTSVNSSIQHPFKKSFKYLIASKFHLFSGAIPTVKSYFPTHFGSLHILGFCRKYTGSVDIRA